MKVYKVSHNIESLLQFDETEVNRYFSTLEAANRVFEDCMKEMSILENISRLYYTDEWLSLSRETYELNDEGEYVYKSGKTYRYISDDCRIVEEFDSTTVEE